IRGVETGPLNNEENTAVMQMLGEAKCLRAMVYHDLVVMFWDVPFTFLPASQLGDNYVIPVMNREEIQNKLIEDLQDIAP
ncbi:RagB/SusD family nutrient uptake outer membrane protein, partial [Phocaeicola vulgatus]|nr:RagB/SusD family nutrient uptake outer membrane protein [Phocaeicola vulgatus]